MSTTNALNFTRHVLLLPNKQLAGVQQGAERYLLSMPAYDKSMGCRYMMCS